MPKLPSLLSYLSIDLLALPASIKHLQYHLIIY